MARRRKTKTAKWIVTGALTALIAGGGYLATTSNRPATRPGAEHGATSATPAPKAPKTLANRPVAKATAAKWPARPIAPVSMPVDAPRKANVPRPQMAVGSD